MPADPAVADALRAAHEARIESRRQRTRSMFQGREPDAGDNGSADTAAAIAAFLRALPTTAVHISPEHVVFWSSTAARHIAQAVERAAMEG